MCAQNTQVRLSEELIFFCQTLAKVLEAKFKETSTWLKAPTSKYVNTYFLYNLFLDFENTAQNLTGESQYRIIYIGETENVRVIRIRIFNRIIPVV